MAASSNSPPSAGASAGRVLVLPNEPVEAPVKRGSASVSVFKPSSAVAAPARVCVIYGYPSATSGHGPRLLQTVTKTLAESGAQFDVLDLYRSRFNPVTSDEEHLLYGKSVPPDVAAIQSVLGRAEVWIFLYPVWWSIPPAILKGWIDRVLTPGFAFRNDSKGSHPLLESKRALIIRTFGGSALAEQRAGNVASSFMEKAVLLTCGIKAVSQDIFSSETLAETAFGNALFQAAGSVRRALGRPTGIPHRLRSISAPYLPPIEQKIKLPLDENDEEKIELSDEAKSDLEYFKSARRQAREAVHRRADASMGGRPSGQGQGQKQKGPSAFGRSDRGGDRIFGRSNEQGGRREGRPRQGGWLGQSQGGSQGRPNQGGGQGRPNTGGSGRPNQGGGQFGSQPFGRKPPGGQGRPNTGGGQSGGRPSWSGRQGKRRRH